LVFLLAVLLYNANADEPGCCLPARLSAAQSYVKSSVILSAYVSGVTCYVDLSCVYSLSVVQVFKGKLSGLSYLGKLSCGTMTTDHVLPSQGSTGVFYATSIAGNVLTLLPCASHGSVTACESAGLITGAIEDCESSNSTFGPDTPPKPLYPNTECDCQNDRDRTWKSGCSTCKCIESDDTCRVSCKADRQCVMIPSMIATGLLILFMGCCMCAVRKWRKRSESNSNDVELVDIPTSQEFVNSARNSQTHMNSQNFGMMPMMSMTQTAPSMMMTTPQGQPVMTQPMYMVTQTGEPVVVQVAYV